MSRRMCLTGNTKMYPSTSTVTSDCAMNYWSNGSKTSDQWHRTVPYNTLNTFLGFNANGADHIAAVCFTSGSFTGKAKKFTFKLSNNSSWPWVNALTCGWQLSEHDWKTAAAWAAGSKDYYSHVLYGKTPSDPNAIAHGKFSISSATITFSGAAAIKPNTQYVLYLWRYGTAQKGMLFQLLPTNQRQLTITITG